MIFLTDFADQGVVLPLIFAVGCALAVLGWPRGALAWGMAAAGTWGVVLCLKLVSIACGPSVLRSPSGHTAAAALVCGGLAMLIGRGRSWVVVLAASLAAGAIGFSRLVLHMHTGLEVAVGAVVGVAGALALRLLAGPPPGGLRLRWLAAVAIVVIVLFHGVRLNAEPRIRYVAFDLARVFRVCRGAPPAYAHHLPIAPGDAAAMAP